MKKIYKKLKENGRNYPELIIICRDGVSEGQYPIIITEEFAAIKEAVSKLVDKLPQFTLMVVTKSHNTRHFLKNELEGNLKRNSEAQSLLPGTYIYEGTRKDLMQFYIDAHKAIQGSAQDTMVTVLVNEADMSNDTANKLVHGLCYLHQVFRGPVSLPEPIYQADELAERGMVVYKAAKENKMIPEEGGKDTYGNYDNYSTADRDGQSYYDNLTTMLSYGKGDLPDNCYNA